MTPEQLQMVRLTFVQVMDRKAETARMFYDRLFEIAPDTKPLFRGTMEERITRLMDSLALGIGTLRDMPSLIGVLEAMARRHVAYGVRDEHYDKMGEALLWTLERVLGPAWTPDARTAWAALYGTVADVMRKAAKGESSSAGSAPVAADCELWSTELAS
jgi:nitric oxide dioxygenase